MVSSPLTDRPKEAFEMAFSVLITKKNIECGDTGKSNVDGAAFLCYNPQLSTVEVATLGGCG
jgi:hypothetical protein